jgi:DNA-binding transcriptional regulator GbsR (MarR family)
MELPEKARVFVFHFGEMGSRWGFNRTVGQILAFLVIHPKALNADQIAQTLSISRGNVSMGLKELQSWRLIQLQHVAGDRKDYFITAGSIWDMAKTVFEERRKREIDPTLSLLRANLLEDAQNEDEEYAQQRIEEIHDLLELLTQWGDHLNTLSPEKLESLMKLGSGISKLLDMKDKIMGKKSTDQ